MEKIFLKDLNDILDKNAIIIGNKDVYFTNVQTSDKINYESLDWVNPIKENKVEYVKNSVAPIILCEFSLQNFISNVENKCIIFVENPKITFLRISNKFFTNQNLVGIHKTAVIHDNAEVSGTCYIGPNTYIGKCKIDEGTIIYGNVYIYDNVIIGKNVVIHAGTIIGADGFGYQRNSNGEFEKFPHIGGVIIEDNVEIGSNTCIDRGALGDTIIKKGAKIDNLVHIAHNVQVGCHTAIIANSMIGGSVVIGNNSWIAPSATIRDQLIIGNNVTVGMASLVTKNIPSDEVWIGSPAKKLR